MSSLGVGHPQPLNGFDQVQMPSTPTLSTLLYSRAGHVRPAATFAVRFDYSVHASRIPSSLAIAPPPLSVFQDLEVSLDAAQRRFLAKQVDNTAVDLLSLAIQVGWCAGWRARCATRIPNRQRVREVADVATQTKPASLNLPKTPSRVTPLPQELIDAIMSEVVDTNALKACALASSSFRGPSQRALLSSLTLHGHQDSAIRELLTTSPHIAPYITKLKIKVPPPRAPFSEFDSLEWILSKLTRVSRCVVTGVSTQSRWGDLTPPFALTFLEYLSRQQLQSLGFSLLKAIPSAVLAQLLTCAPVLSFHHTYVDQNAQSSSPTSKSQTSANSLALDSSTTGVSELLCHPRYTSLLGNLTRLSIQLEPQGHTMNMLRATAQKLRYLRIDCTVVSPNARTLPAFPSLSHLELVLHHLHRNGTHFISTISDILGSTSTLQELIVTYCHTSQYHAPDTPFALTLRALEAYFRLRFGTKNTGAWPLVRWRDALPQQDFDEFTYFVRRTMPTMDRLGKLRFERFEATSEGSKAAFNSARLPLEHP